MKKFFLFTVICLSSFIILNSEILAQTLLLRVLPIGGQKGYRGDTISFTITVLDQDKIPLFGATVNINDSLIIQDFHPTTDSTGIIEYKTIIPSDKPVGVYSVSFIAEAQNFEATSKIIRNIEVQHLGGLSLMAYPDQTITVDWGAEVVYSMVIKDDNTFPVEAVKVEVENGVLDTSFVLVSNEQGSVYFNLLIPEEKPNGTYNIKMSAKKSGYDFAELNRQVIVQHGTDVKEATVRNNINIYPNPAKDEINIKIDNDESGYFEIKIYSSEGRLIEKKEIINSFDGNRQLYYKLNTSSYSQGIYYLVVLSSVKSYSILFFILNN